MVPKMTVAELIEKLKEFPADLPVVVQSYEDGVDPVTDTKTIGIEKNKVREWYFGIFEEVDVSADHAILISSRFNRADKEAE